MKHRGVLATSCAAILLTSCALANTRTHIDRQAKVLKTDTLPVCLSSESNQISTDTLRLNPIPSKIKCGADQIELLTSHLKGKRIALLVNQSNFYQWQPKRTSTRCTPVRRYSNRQNIYSRTWL